MTTPALPSEPEVLYFLDWNEPFSYLRKEDGTIQRNSEEDSWPDGLGDDQPNGVFLVFVGTIHQNTDGWTEAECDAANISIEAMKYSAWWDGQFREATDDEIAAVFCPSLRDRCAQLEGEWDALAEEVVKVAEEVFELAALIHPDAAAKARKRLDTARSTPSGESVTNTGGEK